MPYGSALSYIYDGSFDGLLSCVFESYERKEEPSKILPASAAQMSLFACRYIETDEVKARRVREALKNKVSEEALYIVNRAFLSCLEDKELYILDFIRLCFKLGAKACVSIGNDTVAVLRDAVRKVSNEAGLYAGFVRFSEINKALISVIEPKNYVLPIISRHFCDRFPEDTILIYDKTHKMIMLAQRGRYELSFVDSFELPEAGGEELCCRELWRCFYDTIAVEGRENPRCRMSHMPKRFWGQLTELRDEGRDALEAREQKLLAEGRKAIGAKQG